MKKRIISFIAAGCIIINTMVIPSTKINASNDDNAYDTYSNLNTEDLGYARYIVPNLYRQDASYANFKKFPLVIEHGEEYVPIDIFAQFSYIKVVYSKLTDGFYLNNVKNNRYVAFDMVTGTTTTNDTQIVEIEARIYNHTHYVPASYVCGILGLKMDTYDDYEKGIRAVRIYDGKAKLSMEELIKRYSPTKKEPQQQEVADSDEKNNAENAQNNGETQTNNESSSATPETGNDSTNNPSKQVNTSTNSEENSDDYADDNKPSIKPANTNKPDVSHFGNSTSTQSKPAYNITAMGSYSLDNQSTANTTSANNATSANDGKTASDAKQETQKTPVATQKPNAEKPSSTENKQPDLSGDNVNTSTPAVTQPATAKPSVVTPPPVQPQPPSVTVTPNVPSVQQSQQPTIQPITQNPPAPIVSPPVVSSGADNTSSKSETIDPYTQVAPRKIYVTFNVSDIERTKEILDILAAENISAVFFVSKDQILTASDVIRQMLVEGHSIGISFDATAGEQDALSNDAILEQINAANDALNMVAKFKSRYIRAEYDKYGKIKNALTEHNFVNFAKQNGYEVCDWNVDSGDSVRYRAAQFDTLKDELIGANAKREAAVFVKFDTEGGTKGLLEALIAFTKKYPQFYFRITDEYTVKVSFIGN